MEDKCVKPLVSVFVASYNNASYIVESLESVRLQSYPNIELIIIDDCSSDNSVYIIQEWIKENDITCELICNQSNLGICAVSNIFLSYAKGKYYSWLASDDLMLPEKISRQVEIMEASSSNVALVYSDAYLIGPQGENFFGRFIQWHRHFFTVPQGHIFPELVKDNFIPVMSVLWRKECVESVGMYDESLPYEDYDILLRLSIRYDFVFSDFVSVKYRLHNSNMHKKLQNVQTMEANFSIFYKHLGVYNKNYDKIIKERLNFYLLRMYDLKSDKIKEYFKKYYEYFEDNNVMRLALSSGVSYYRLARIQRLVKKIGLA